MSGNPVQVMLVHELSDLYSAEKQILHSMEKVIAHIADEHLKNVLAHHIKETDVHVTRLEQIAQETQFELDTKHVCKGMQGILAEADQVLKDFTDELEKDAAFVLAARKVEHYEIAGYLSAILLARSLEETQMIAALDQTLAEEREADNKLVTLEEDTLLKKLTDQG